MTATVRQAEGGLGWVLLDDGAHRFLAEATAVLIGHRHVDGLLHDAVRPLVPSQADVAVIDAIGDDGGHARIFSRTANPQGDATARQRANGLVPPPTHGGSPAALALYEGRVIVHGEFGDASGQQAHSVLTLPIRHDGRVLASLTVITFGRHDRYGRASVTLLDEYGRRVGVALATARAVEAIERDRLEAASHREVLQHTVTALERSLAALQPDGARERDIVIRGTDATPASVRVDVRAATDRDDGPRPLRSTLRRTPAASVAVAT